MVIPPKFRTHFSIPCIYLFLFFEFKKEKEKENIFILFLVQIYVYICTISNNIIKSNYLLYPKRPRIHSYFTKISKFSSHFSSSLTANLMKQNFIVIFFSETDSSILTSNTYIELLFLEVNFKKLKS